MKKIDSSDIGNKPIDNNKTNITNSPKVNKPIKDVVDINLGMIKLDEINTYSPHVNTNDKAIKNTVDVNLGLIKLNDLTSNEDISKNKDYEYFYLQIKDTITQMRKSNHVDKEVVLICGDTGAGKSTLVNYLLGEEAIAEPKEFSKQFQIGFKNPQAEVGSGFTSMTSIPKRYSLSNKMYWDCPGFDDNRGSMTDITNAFGMQQLNGKADKFKILVVIEEDSLIARRGQILKSMINKIIAMFPDEQKLTNSVTLCFTKASKIKDYKQELVNIFKETKDFKPDQLQFLKTIVTNGSFTVFPAPVQKGVVSDVYRKELLQLQEASTSTKARINPIITPRSFSDMNKLLVYTNDKATDILYNTSNKILNFLPNIKDQNLKEFTQAFIDTVYPINEDQGDIEILSNLEKLIKLHLYPISQEISKDIEELKFFSSEVCAGLIGKFFPHGECFELDTLQLPITSMFDGIKKSLEARGMKEFSQNIDQQVKTTMSKKHKDTNK